MISLRQHVASLVAVFLALAVGIALGGGPLASGDDDDQQGSGERDTATPAAAPTPAPDDRSGFADVFADEGAGRLYANGLDGHATAILAMPGADPAHLEALESQIAVAGGAVTGTYTVGDTLFDPAATSPIDDLTTLLIAQLVDPRVDSSAPTYERLGQLVGIAMATTEASSVRADLAAVAVRESLAGPELLTSPADVRNAPLVLVVLPLGAEGATSSLASRTILTGLTSGIAHNAAGVVVVGDETSAEDGELAALREGELTGTVSTVDGIETTIGQVTAVLALEAAIAGTTGSFGASGSDGAVPLG